MVSRHGQLLSRRGRSRPANAGGLDTHRASISLRLVRGGSLRDLASVHDQNRSSD
jgi:hypothetical protein